MSVAYGPTTALLVVDVQNDFADPAGALAVRDGDAVVAIANAEIARAVAAGALVAYTADWHPPTTPHFAKDGGTWPVHCVADTWGAALRPALVVEGPVIRKGVHGEDGYSGFSIRDPVTGQGGSTGLAELLRGRGITSIVVCGIATDYCVKETALDGVAEGFGVTVLGDGVRAVDRRAGDGERALAEVRAAGATVV